MANPPKKKGTAYETSLVARLRRVWPDIDRAKANNASDDFTGPFPIEAKKRKRLEIGKWTRTLEELSPGRWLLLAAPGDARTADAHPELAVLPAEMALELLELAYGVRARLHELGSDEFVPLAKRDWEV